jgi:hypothetical protein
MFELHVLICLMSGACMEVIDLKGPYESKQACIERAAEVSAGLRKEAAQPMTFAYKCLKQVEA